MTGLLTRITEQPPEVLDAIANSMNVRASEPAMKAICARYMARIALSEGARVLEIGCGNGAATKLIMQHVSPAQLVGIDPSSAFIDMAGKAFAGEPRVSFATGDATATGQVDGCFDLVIAHTVYSHLVEPERALAEAHRVLRPGGQLAIFDATLQRSPSPCSTAILCRQLRAWCCGIWCTHRTSCGGFPLSSPQRGSACSRSSPTVMCRRRVRTTC